MLSALLAVSAVAQAAAPSPASQPLATAPTIPLGPPSEPAPPAMKALGGDRYQIGSVLVDKRARRVTVPGRVLHLGEGPLEYLAVSPHGLKAYESLLEVDATGSEFNLALILIGCDAEQSTRPAFQFDRHLPDGQLLDLSIRWIAAGRTKTATAAEALLPDAQRQQTPPSDWVYTGSSTVSPKNSQYAADVSGTLVGFVHDPADVVEHRLGLGIGQYGSVRGNSALLPPVGTAVELIVTLTGKVSAPATR
jgi:hypothetical protein